MSDKILSWLESVLVVVGVVILYSAILQSLGVMLPLFSVWYELIGFSSSAQCLLLVIVILFFLNISIYKELVYLKRRLIITNSFFLILLVYVSLNYIEQSKVYAVIFFLSLIGNLVVYFLHQRSILKEDRFCRIDAIWWAANSSLYDYLYTAFLSVYFVIYFTAVKWLLSIPWLSLV